MANRNQRRPIVAANWKMHGDLATLSALALAIRDETAGSPTEIVLCPPFPYLIPIGAALDGTIVLGAQDVHFDPPGPHTGDVAATMLADLGCRYAIVGHSERRANHGETDELVRDKVAAVFDAGLHAIVCLGETLGQREAGETETVLERQLTESLRGLTSDADRFVILIGGASLDATSFAAIVAACVA